MVRRLQHHPRSRAPLREEMGQSLKISISWINIFKTTKYNRSCIQCERGDRNLDGRYDIKPNNCNTRQLKIHASESSE